MIFSLFTLEFPYILYVFFHIEFGFTTITVRHMGKNSLFGIELCLVNRTQGPACETYLIQTGSWGNTSGKELQHVCGTASQRKGCGRESEEAYAVLEEGFICRQEYLSQDYPAEKLLRTQRGARLLNVKKNFTGG
jgi:hypothetical protein